MIQMSGSVQPCAFRIRAGKESGSAPDVDESSGGICPAIRVNY